MKKLVKSILKSKDKLNLYTDERYNIVKDTLTYGLKNQKDVWLKSYIELDTINNKSQWIADMLIKLTEEGHI